MRKLLVLLMVILVTLSLYGCGGKTGVGGNILKDEGSLVKIMDDFKNLSNLKGKDIMVFQSLSIFTGETGNRVMINILKPGTKEDVDAYEYKNGSWSGPKPVQITGRGKMDSNLFPLRDIDFSKVPAMYKIMETELKGFEGAKIDDFLTFQLWSGKVTGLFGATSTRAKFNAEFALDGKLIKFSKR